MGHKTMSEWTIYLQHDFPIFQNRVYNSAEEAIDCPRGDIRIVQNDRTGLVYNAAFDPSRMHYDSAYQNEQGHSATFDAHMEKVADLILETLGTADLIEVGCGKGLFLDKLRASGASITGFDPAYEGSDPTIVKSVFDERITMQGKGLILRHVLEHIANPVDFLRRLSAANGYQGLIYVEVPCFDWILANGAWFDLFYEHVNYFRLGDFQRMFGRVVRLGRSFDGQYLSVVADLSSLREPVSSSEDPVRLPEGFLPDLGRDTTVGRVIWGGASKGVIFSLLLQRAGHPVARVIDINTAKQDKYMPGTGLLVESPAQVLPELAPGTVVLVMNPNYLAEIREMGGPEFDYRSVHDL
jgi:hypothetical protein